MHFASFMAAVNKTVFAVAYYKISLNAIFVDYSVKKIRSRLKTPQKISSIVHVVWMVKPQHLGLGYSSVLIEFCIPKSYPRGAIIRCGIILPCDYSNQQSGRNLTPPIATLHQCSLIVISVSTTPFYSPIHMPHHHGRKHTLHEKILVIQIGFSCL